MIRLASIACLLSIVLAGCAGGWNPIQSRDQRLAAAAERYVQETRGWSKDDFTIDVIGPRFDYVELWVVHRDDPNRVRGPSGSGQSFAVDIDPETMTVKRELEFR